MKKFRDWMPSPEKLRESRWLRWLGPALFQPHLWHIGRRGIAMGMALGVFFGLLVPIAQIPLSAAAAIVMRGNVPTAVAATFVSNPLTFGPLYYAAWRIGTTILGHEPMPDVEAMAKAEANAEADAPNESWWTRTHRRILSVGRPLLLGLGVMATVVGLLTYLLVSVIWRLRVVWLRRRRLDRRRDLPGRSD